MPQPNYQFAKRQRELEKKRKNAEKAARKAAGVNVQEEERAPENTAPQAPPEPTA